MKTALDHQNEGFVSVIEFVRQIATLAMNALPEDAPIEGSVRLQEAHDAAQNSGSYYSLGYAANAFGASAHPFASPPTDDEDVDDWLSEMHTRDAQHAAELEKNKELTTLANAIGSAATAVAFARDGSAEAVLYAVRAAELAEEYGVAGIPGLRKRYGVKPAPKRDVAQVLLDEERLRRARAWGPAKAHARQSVLSQVSGLDGTAIDANDIAAGKIYGK